MIYRPYGKTGKNIAALGFGSARFRAEDLKDEEGLRRCANLVRRASALGVNFFDVAPVYADGFGERIYGLAFQDMPNPFFVSAKSIITADKTADDVRRRIERQLNVMGIEKIAFYHMWSIMNSGHYERVMAKGGPYEGAVRAKKEGLVEHVCFSTHANPAENLEMIHSGAFEGMIISLNATNYTAASPAVRAAADQGMGVAAMNPLGGGMIVQYPQYFEYLLQPGDADMAEAALRFVASFPGLTTAISGMAAENEIERNVAALSGDPVSGRFERVEARSTEINGRLCTGCGYCRGCPEAIPVADYMRAYNMRLFPKMEYYGRVLPFTDEDQIQADNVFRTLRRQTGLMPESADNPCVKCGECEKKCTQGLPIAEFMENIAGLAARHEYSRAHLRRRIENLARQTPSGRIGLYPAGVYAEAFYAFLTENFPDRRVKVFDKNPELWGQKFADLAIEPPKDIPDSVETLLIVHYLYQDAIYKELCGLTGKGVRVVKLHQDGDIPYFG
jgi:predicted aldo/keto reductase-like oxidoreductase